MKNETIYFHGTKFSVPRYTHKTIGDLIRLGDYDKSHSMVSEEWFSVQDYTGNEGAKLCLASVYGPTCFQDAFSLFYGMNIPGAGVKEMLAFGAEFPDMQRDYDIVAIGAPSVCFGTVVHDFFPMLKGGSNHRHLTVASSLGGIIHRTRFLLHTNCYGLF